LDIGETLKPCPIALAKLQPSFASWRFVKCPSFAIDEEHQDRTRAVNNERRLFLEALVTRLQLEFIPTHANFMLGKVGDGDALFHHAMKHGVILRAMRAYGLPEWIRVSIGTMSQNQKFATILEAWQP
jgi:histidinol-phosphate aminotransferase